MVDLQQGEWTVHSNLNQLVLQRMVERGEVIRQIEIARATGIDKNTIARWMSNEPLKTINASVVVALCSYLNCDVGDLLVIDRGGQRGPHRSAEASQS